MAGYPIIARNDHASFMVAHSSAEPRKNFTKSDRENERRTRHRLDIDAKGERVSSKCFSEKSWQTIGISTFGYHKVQGNFLTLTGKFSEVRSETDIGANFISRQIIQFYFFFFPTKKA